MKILIIEDEHPTAKQLASILSEYKSSVTIVDILSSVEESQLWFGRNQPPDLIFQDIELSDGNCFDIYKDLNITTPIVFTTAHSEYVMKSFELNNIGYVVKPYSTQDIFAMLRKFENLNKSTQIVNPKKTVTAQDVSKKFQKRLLIKLGTKFKSVDIENVALIESDNGITYMVTMEGTRFPIEHTIKHWENALNPDLFFRINRKTIVGFKAIENVHVWFNSRLKLQLKNVAVQQPVVSRERVPDFKKWLGN